MTRTSDGACCICGKPISGSWLMCHAHWAEVPGPIRREVTGAWARVQRLKPGAAAIDRTGLLNAYRKARDAAIASVAEVDAYPAEGPMTSPGFLT